jgi:hypothetical protein
MSETYVMFPHVEGHWTEDKVQLQRDVARIMVASCRRTMPGVAVKMITDLTTPAIEGVDEVLRKRREGWHWIPWLTDFCAQLRGNVLYLDTDIVVQKDLRVLFNVPCDALFTNRGDKIFQGRNMPFLFGVVAYRTPEFWLEVRDRVMAMPEQLDWNWWGSQVAVWEMFVEQQQGRDKWKIACVDKEVYNYTPKNPMDRPADKWVLHFKGDRKQWMYEEWKHLLTEKAVA